MYQADMHPETLRKAGVGIKMAADAGMLSISESTNDTYREQYIAKKQFYDQRREYNNLLTREAREANLMGFLKDAVKELNKQCPLIHRGVLPDPLGKNEAVLVLSDWHYGMVADNIWNRYNTEICRRRVDALKEKVIQRIQLHNISKLYVFVLGDMCNGAIHVTSRVASEEHVVDQLIHVSEMIAELIGELSDYVLAVDVHCTYGNHMRTVQNKFDSIHADNMERIIPWWLKERFADTDHVVVKNTGADEMIHAFVCNRHQVCGVHGDLDGEKYSVLTLAQMHERAYGIKPDYLFSGHYHSLNDTECCDITSIRAGGLCGTDEFAKNKRLFSAPSQTLAIFNDEGLDALYHIKLGA